MAAQQHVTWSAGTHTSTPVLIGASGPPEAIREFTGMMHATDVGKRMIDLLTAGQTARTAGAAQ